MNDKASILIAEDDPFLGKIISNRLREEEYIVDIATDGNEALDKIGQKNYAVVMLDLVMPGKTGFDVLKELRDGNVSAPVLVFTNLAQDEDRDEVMRLGAKGYYVKSDIAMDDLVLTIKNFINE